MGLDNNSKHGIIIGIVTIVISLPILVNLILNIISIQGLDPDIYEYGKILHKIYNKYEICKETAVCFLFLLC